MSTIDLEQLLGDVSPENPCGENCEYSPEFYAIEAAASGKPEREMGAEKIAAENPEWSEVKSQSLELLGGSKDLRVAVYLTRALLHTEGWAGLADGLALLKGLLVRHWNTVHPQLDADDDEPALLRVNSLNPLTVPLGQADPASSVPFEVRQIPLVQSKGLGRFDLRALDIATGKLTVTPQEGEELPQQSAIEAAFLDCDPQLLQTDAMALDSAIANLREIDTTLQDRLGVDQAPDLKPLLKELDSAQRIVSAKLSERGLSAPSGANGLHQEADMSSDGEPQGAADAPLPARTGAGTITTRNEVADALDKICAYYQRYEPSSPVPILLQRAKGLVHKDFIDIMKELAPEAVSQLELLRGPIPDDSPQDASE